MPMTDSYRHHLMMLEEIKRNIQSLKSHLYTIEERYKQQINASHAAGFMQAYTDQLQQMHQRFHLKIENMAQLIEKHQQQLDQQKEILQRLRETARRHPNA